MQVIYCVHFGYGLNTFKRKADAEFHLLLVRHKYPNAYIEVRDTNAARYGGSDCAVG